MQTTNSHKIYFHVPLYQYEYYCNHLFRPKKDSLTWSLDYEKMSDFNDVAGHWHVEEHPTKEVISLCANELRN